MCGSSGIFGCVEAENKSGVRKLMRDAFSDCHPMVNFIFYLGALLMSVAILHPAILAGSLIGSFGYRALLRKGGLKHLVGMLGMILFITLMNPLVNGAGERVLFTWWGDRAYTVEALCYGLALASMVAAMLTWFSTYNQVMTEDKFLYCFGKLAPTLSLILTMVLRMVPAFQKKAGEIGGARRCIGRSVENGSVREKAEHGLTIVSALTSWALEGGVVTADSMRSRGFGTGVRTSFSHYRMKGRDRILLVWMITLFCMVIVCALGGCMSATYTPQLCVSGTEDMRTVLGAVCSFLFLCIPAAMNLWEELQWRILK